MNRPQYWTPTPMKEDLRTVINITRLIKITILLKEQNLDYNKNKNLDSHLHLLFLEASIMVHK